MPKAEAKNNPGTDGIHQLDLSHLTSGSAHSMTTCQPGADNTFRCADAGNPDCHWETNGATEDEIVKRAEEHWRKEHGMADWTEAARSKARDAIKHRQAA